MTDVDAKVGEWGGFDIWAARWYWLYYNVIYVYNIDQQQHIGYYITTPHYYIETLYIYMIFQWQQILWSMHMISIIFVPVNLQWNDMSHGWFAVLFRGLSWNPVCVVIPFTPRFFDHMVISINLHNNLHDFDDYNITISYNMDHIIWTIYFWWFWELS